MRCRVLLILAFLASSLTGRPRAAQQDPAGTWIGQWERDGSLLEVEVNFARTASGYEGAFSSAQLRVVGIPFRRIRYEGSRLFWELVGDATPTRFEATVLGDALAGRFPEGDATGTVRLTRGTPAVAQVRESEVNFDNRLVTLSGTVMKPAGPGPFPGVVFLHGSGAEGRWASRYLANAFARREIGRAHV